MDDTTLDAIEGQARFSALTGDGVAPARSVIALVAEVRRLTSHADGLSANLGGDLIAWAARAEAAEAEVVTLRAKVAAVEATLHGADVTSEFLAASGDTHDAAMAGAVFAVTDNVRAALATTGEGE